MDSLIDALCVSIVPRHTALMALVCGMQGLFDVGKHDGCSCFGNELVKMLNALEPGDVVVVARLDRLARSIDATTIGQLKN